MGDMPSKGYRKFSPEQLAKLSQLYEQMPLREAAELAGMSYGSALYQLRQLGLHKTFAQRYQPNPVTASTERLAYTAGLIDGEGTVSLRKFTGKWKPSIRIANTSWPLMEWLRETFDGPSIFIEHRRIRQSRLQCYMFHIQGLGHLPLYEALLPLMVIKRSQMECVIEFTRERLTHSRDTPLSERQLELIATVRDLNIKPSTRLAAA